MKKHIAVLLLLATMGTMLFAVDIVIGGSNDMDLVFTTHETGDSGLYVNNGGPVYWRDRTRMDFEIYGRDVGFIGRLEMRTDKGAAFSPNLGGLCPYFAYAMVYGDLFDSLVRINAGKLMITDYLVTSTTQEWMLSGNITNTGKILSDNNPYGFMMQMLPMESLNLGLGVIAKDTLFPLAGSNYIPSVSSTDKNFVYLVSARYDLPLSIGSVILNAALPQISVNENYGDDMNFDATFQFTMIDNMMAGVIYRHYSQGIGKLADNSLALIAGYNQEKFGMNGGLQITFDRNEDLTNFYWEFDAYYKLASFLQPLVYFYGDTNTGNGADTDALKHFDFTMGLDLMIKTFSEHAWLSIGFGYDSGIQGNASSTGTPEGGMICPIRFSVSF